MRRSVRVSCGLGGHVRDRHRCREGEYALVSSGFTKTAHPACPLACAPAALGCADRPESKFSPLNCAPRCRVAHLPRNVESGTTPLPPHAPRFHVRIHAAPHPPDKSRRLGRIVKEAASKVVEKAALAQPREPPNLRGGPGQGVGEKGLPTSHPKTGGARENWQPRRRARRTPTPGECGLLRLNSRVGGGQTTQPWVSQTPSNLPASSAPPRNCSVPTLGPEQGCAPARGQRPTQSSVWPCSSALRHSLPRKKVF